MPVHFTKLHLVECDLRLVHIAGADYGAGLACLQKSKLLLHGYGDAECVTVQRDGSDLINGEFLKVQV